MRLWWYWNRSQKTMLSEKVLEPYRKNLVVLESVSEKIATGKKSRNRYQKNLVVLESELEKYLVPGKSIGIGIV